MNRDKRGPECGVGPCRPKLFRRFANIGWFTGFYSITGLMTSSLSMYIISQITTIERQFGFSSTKSGYLMACNDVGYSVFILIASYFANRVHIPRVLCMSTMLYGISGILCSIPHFIFKPEPLTDTGSSNINTRYAPPGLCSNETGSDIIALLTTSSNYTDIKNTQEQRDTTRGNVAMAFISIGMIVQGLSKAPRSPMLAQYIDDNTKRTDTGFYMGIITTVSIFGPAIAYGLGGLFSQTYVTLEDVDLHPSDPRWIGAWWLGFLVFGVAAILFAVPIFFFPAKMRPKSFGKSRTPTGRPCRLECRLICAEIKGVGKSIARVLRTPSFTCMLISCIISVIGMSAGFAFGPKYLEVEFNVPSWQSNIILAAFMIVSVCAGAFTGGVLTKKLHLTPSRCIVLILVPQIPSIAMQFINMFQKCDQPTIHNWPVQSMASLPPPCNSECSCGSTFLPVCDGAGNNYFSPCHAGCSGGSLYKFTNCTCIPGEQVSTGLCKFDCNKLWPFMVVAFIGQLLVASLMMPIFVFNIRIVEDELKSMAIGIFSLCTSLFAWLPGPVIGGKLVDSACILWSGGKVGKGSCSFYNLDTLRYNLLGIGIACRCVGLIFLFVILRLTWNMTKWPSEKDTDDIDFMYESYTKNKPNALIVKNANVEKK